MNAGILTPPTQFAAMPRGLLGRPGPVPMPNDMAFDPLSVAGLSAWYDAADASTITLNGSAVSVWRDKSGNGLHASQSTANNQPLYAATRKNSLPVITFDGANDSLVTSQFADPYLSFTSFCVLSVIASANIGFNVVWTRSTDRQRSVVIVAFGGAVAFGTRVHLTAATGIDYDYSQAFPFNAWALMTHQWDGSVQSSGVAVSGKINGVNYPNQVNGVISPSNISNTVLRLGNRSDGARGVNAHVGELLIYSSSLSPVSTRNIEGYLRAKWGM